VLSHQWIYYSKIEVRLFEILFIVFSKYLILGISWSVGGDYHYSKILTLPNILRRYNAKLKGFSTKGYVMSDNRYATNNGLNVGKYKLIKKNIFTLFCLS